MTRWYQHRYHTLLSHRIVFAIIPKLPKFLHPPIAAVTALIFFLLLRRERAAVMRNLSHILGPGRLRLRWEAWRVFYSFCDFIVSYCYVPRASHAKLLGMLTGPNAGAAVIDRCLERGAGVIVWTAHLGNWEFASRLLEMHGRVVHVARVVEPGKPVERMLRGLMTNPRLEIVDLREGVAATLRLLHVLRSNGIVAIQGDRVYQGFDASLEFFGGETRFPLGPFLLARVSGAPVVPGVVLRDGWLRYRVIMGEPIEMPRTADRDADLKSGLTAAVRFLEQTLRQHHDQWLNFYDFWPQPPAGARTEGRTALESET